MLTRDRIGALVMLAFSIGYDMEPYTNMLSKHDLLQRAVSGEWRIAIDHEPGDAIVRVEADPRKPGQYRLIPA